jgi:hypothetical protein
MRLTMTAAAATLAAGAAFGQAQPPALEEAFRAADVNGDGAVNVDEFVAHFIGVFADLDKNRDGKLAFADIPNADAARFRAADRDGDLMLSLGEVVADRIYHFFEMDTNRDGVISLEELLAYERRLTAAR